MPSTRIQRWARDVTAPGDDDVTGSENIKQNQQEQVKGVKYVDPYNASSDMRYEAYMALLDHRIRNAYVSILLDPCA